jgi:hypothetical protein
MKQNLKKILALTMALTVLVSSHSFAYFEHLCTITKVKTLSFHLETCAGDFVEATPSDAASIKKSVCCEISYKVNQADNAVQQNFNLAFAPFLAELVAIPHFKFEQPLIVLAQEPALNHGDSSPPLLVPIYLLNEQFIL